MAINNIEVGIIAEPATLSLLALGGLALRRRWEKNIRERTNDEFMPEREEGA